MNAFMGRFTFSRGRPPETTGLSASSRSWEPEDEEAGAVGVGGSRLQAWSCERPGSAMGMEEALKRAPTRPLLESETLISKPGILKMEVSS